MSARSTRCIASANCKTSGLGDECLDTARWHGSAHLYLRELVELHRGQPGLIRTLAPPDALRERLRGAWRRASPSDPARQRTFFSLAAPHVPGARPGSRTRAGVTWPRHCRRDDAEQPDEPRLVVVSAPASEDHRHARRRGWPGCRGRCSGRRGAPPARPRAWQPEQRGGILVDLKGGSRRRSCSGAGRWLSSSTRARSSSRARTVTRSWAAIGLVAPGNGLVIVDASDSSAKGPAPKRLADAIAAAGGTVRGFKSPREGALAGWIESEARERGLTSRPAPQGARRAGRRVRPRGRRRPLLSDEDRVDGARQARPVPGRVADHA